MKFLTIFLLFALCCANAFASDCVVKGHGFKVNESYTPIGECIKYTCVQKGQLGAVTCPAVATLKPCKFTQTDTTKPYPHCCPKHDC